MDDDITRVTVPPHFSHALRQAVADGEYPSVEAALAEALETWSRRHEDLAWMKAKIRASMLDPTPSLTLAQVDARLAAFIAAAEREEDAAA